LIDYLKPQSNIILASASPRRRELLTEAGYKFTIVPSSIDESVFSTENVSSAEYAKKLALAKANDVAGKYPDSIVVGADTVVDFDGQIIGKPDDSKHAEEITRKLFSKPHKVITGLAIICKSRNLEIVEAETTTVYPRKLTDAQIAGHIESGIWQGKAGAYSISDNDPFVDHIDGSFTNVMGMPMELFTRLCP
jgi:septum formation protein